jgi:hypothetical protein
VDKIRFLVLLAILGLVGCQGVVGPFGYRQAKRVDDPILPIPEQQKLGRDQLALPVESYEAGPPTGIVPPGVFSK